MQKLDKFRYQNTTPMEEEETEEDEEEEEEDDDDDDDDDEDEDDDDDEDETDDEEEDEELNEEEMEKLLELFMARSRGGSKMDMSNQKNDVDQEQKRREAVEIAGKNTIEEWKKEQKRSEELARQELVRQMELKTKEDQKRCEGLARQELKRRNELRAREDQKRREQERHEANKKDKKVHKRPEDEDKRRAERADKFDAIMLKHARSTAKRRSRHYSRSVVSLKRNYINRNRGPVRRIFSKLKKKLFG